MYREEIYLVVDVKMGTVVLETDSLRTADEWSRDLNDGWKMRGHFGHRYVAVRKDDFER